MYVPFANGSFSTGKPRAERHPSCWCNWHAVAVVLWRKVSFQNGSTSPQKPTSGMAGGDLSRGTMMIWRRLSPEGSNRFMLSPTMLHLGTEETNMCQTCLLCYRKYQYLEGGDFDLWQHLCHQPGLHGTISKVNATEKEEVLHKFFSELEIYDKAPFHRIKRDLKSAQCKGVAGLGKTSWQWSWN